MSTEPAAAPLSRREQAVARSLDPARARANDRVQRYLDAALELMQNDSSREFTVQEVVERSGQSLRGFYQYFAGKHELLLAVFEESVRTTALHLRDAIADLDDPLDRLRSVVVEYHRLCRPDLTRVSGKVKQQEGPPRALAEFAQRLLTAHPDEAAQAFTPLTTLFEELLADAAAAGTTRTDLPIDRIAGVVLEAVMFNSFTTTISGSRSTESDAEVLWKLLLHGLHGGPDAPQT
jgi:AcrR family transcriptional regulator